MENKQRGQAFLSAHGTLTLSQPPLHGPVSASALAPLFPTPLPLWKQELGQEKRREKRKKTAETRLGELAGHEGQVSKRHRSQDPGSVLEQGARLDSGASPLLCEHREKKCHSQEFTERSSR